MPASIKNLLVKLASGRTVTSVAMSIFGRGTPIFVMHRTSSSKHGSHGLDPDHLRRCLSYLADKQYNFISLEDVVLSLESEYELPPKAVAFTIDDGYRDQAEVAAPIFLEFDCPLTIFVITDLLESNWWPWDAKVSWIIDASQCSVLTFSFAEQKFDIQISTSEERRLARQTVRDWLKTQDSNIIPEFIHELCVAAEVVLPVTPPRPFEGMDWNLARTLERQGIRIAPHSRSHNIMSKLDDKNSANEILHSWKRLTQELTGPSKIFCYPTGKESDYGEREIATLRESGFKAALTTEPGFIDTDALKQNANLIYQLPRLIMPDSFTDFVQYSTWIEYFKSRIR